MGSLPWGLSGGLGSFFCSLSGLVSPAPEAFPEPGEKLQIYERAKYLPAVFGASPKGKSGKGRLLFPNGLGRPMRAPEENPA